MNAKISHTATAPRLLSTPQMCDYLGMGRNSALQFCKEIRATRHIGRRVVHDRDVIDRHLDMLSAEAED